MPRQFFCHH